MSAELLIVVVCVGGAFVIGLPIALLLKIAGASERAAKAAEEAAKR